LVITTKYIYNFTFDAGLVVIPQNTNPHRMSKNQPSAGQSHSCNILHYNGSFINIQFG